MPSPPPSYQFETALWAAIKRGRHFERSGTYNQPTVSVRWKELNRLLGYEEHCRPDEPVKLPLLLDPNKARRRPRASSPLRLRRPPRPRRHAPSV